MTSNYEKLRALLRELFQMDQADLDFGLYRIMNAKRDEIERFLEHDLLPQVKAELARHVSVDSGAKKSELDETIANAKKLGVDPDKVPRVLELRDALKQGTDLESLENEVFSHLYNFFRRYYHQGDFLSLRRYKEGVYAIPYEGEEVKLYWANHDQYYIKSSEYLRNYTFKLRDNRRVTFKVVAADAEADNNKPQSGKERRFVIVDSDAVTVEGSELSVRFRYEPDERKQADLNAAAVSAVLGNANLTDWLTALSDARPTEKNPQRTVLAKHLDDFTARYSFDYFIHKDLGGFFRRELDFFIKNEVMHLDDVEDETVAKVDCYLSKIKALRKIAHKVIAFLEQLENFQKKLWLKKKFIVATHYCVTLDRVAPDLYPEIAANRSQVDEWKTLYHVHMLERSTVNVPFSEPPTVEFLKANPSLVVDTRHFDERFRLRLCSGFQSIDTTCDGILIHGDNFHALSLASAPLQGGASTVFIDPPYNTGVDGFPYKDAYQHSSWLTMMQNRMEMLTPLLSPKAIVFTTIDFVEVSKLRLLYDQIFGAENFLADIAWEKRYTRSNNAKRFYSLKDTVLCYRATPELQILRERRSDKSKENYSNPDHDKRGDWISSSYVNPATKAERPNLVYPIQNPFTGKSVEHPTHAWKYDRETHEQHVADKRLYWGLDGSYEFPRLKSFLVDASEGMVPIDVWSYKETGTTDDGGKALKAIFGAEVFDNPKPPTLISRALQLDQSADTQNWVVDFFGGSGSTAQAVMEANRAGGKPRKFLLVEMGQHFNTVLLPRVKRLMYAAQWVDGKPQHGTGSSYTVKYVKLESYEDCLNNLTLERSQDQNDLLARQQQLREDYLLGYTLDVETHGSASLLNAEKFNDPFNYQLHVSTGTVGETNTTKVDLVETFNWLLGLTVMHVDEIRKVRVVEGTNPKGHRVLILWRNVAEVPNDKLDEWFKAQGYNTRDQEYDLIYVNGDNNLENLRRADQTWKVRLIEEDFHKLMWQCDDV